MEMSECVQMLAEDNCGMTLMSRLLGRNSSQLGRMPSLGDMVCDCCVEWVVIEKIAIEVDDEWMVMLVVIWLHC
jgi:hypothetical protein